MADVKKTAGRRPEGGSHDEAARQPLPVASPPSKEALRMLLAEGARLADATDERVARMFMVTEADLATYHD